MFGIVQTEGSEGRVLLRAACMQTSAAFWLPHIQYPAFCSSLPCNAALNLNPYI